MMLAFWEKLRRLWRAARNKRKVPTEVLKYMEWRMGRSIELEKVTEVVGDGYNSGKHGKWRVFVYRHENILLIVRYYEDGYIDPGYIGSTFR